MDDHYMLLEEMIRLGKTDIQLSYNTNISKLKYRDKDLIKLWSQFKHKVQIYASQMTVPKQSILDTAPSGTK